jgi:hypothetical protein
MARKDAVGNTRGMTSIPSPDVLPPMAGLACTGEIRRTVNVGAIGLIVAVVLLWFMPWGMAVVGGWDAAALAFLMSVWPIIIHADSSTPRSWQNAPTRSKSRWRSRVRQRLFRWPSRV